MSHTSGVESRSNPDGLQEIRSWASRSPGAARPGFRARSQPGGFRLSSRLVASIGFALLLLLVLTGYRSLQNGQGTADPSPTPEPEQVATLAPFPVEEAPPATAVVPEAPRFTQEPVLAPATLPEPLASEEHLQKEAAAVQPKPAAEELEISSAIVVGRDVFESEAAVLLSVPEPEYPEAARGTGTSARVIVGFTIDETGTVRNPVIDRTQIQGDAPKAPFEQAALDAVRGARFVPAQERGVPARSWSTLTFSFETGPQTAGNPATHPPDRSRTGSTR